MTVATPAGSTDPAVDAGVFAANVVQFGRVLRRAGLSVDAEQTRRFVQVASLLGFDRRADVKTAGRAVFVRRRDECATYDAAFDLFWRRSTVVGGTSTKLPRIRQRDEPSADVNFGPEARPGIEVADVEKTAQPMSSSMNERLRTADFADLTLAETRDAFAMLAALKPRLPMRPSRRRRLARTGQRLAVRLMTRRSLATGGEVLDWRWLRRVERPRPIVLVCDISGSMQRYSRFLLRFAHALARSGAPLEIFVFGTRLTRITREFRVRDPDVALGRVADKVVDWSGGTRIGESLHTLNRRWIRRTVRSGAVVLLISDGWERGNPDGLAREMATLRRSCHRLIWLDPLASRPAFEPTTQGLLAALPFVDDFLPCANVASLEALARSLGEMTAAGSRESRGRGAAAGVR
jgi:uncharacterized protein with von Willebrand factor type A (vWA) domain